MNNIFVLNKNYKKIGTLSNQGVKPLAPYYNDLYIQDLETGADTYQFSTISNAYTQDCIEIGNHIMFSYKNRNELFTITSLEHSHSEGYKTVGVYAESIGFELLEVYMEKPKKTESDDDKDGNDSDNDGDDNYDDEYADVDDIYIDENGNIIYDKDGSGLGDVTVDGNGNIIYKPKEKKKDRPSDLLEFKNISYPTFLGIVLKKTGWNYVCQPGLESNKHDITISYDTNIFAILQDSMQSYRGVELEFVYEYNNGKVQKTIKAYKDGGRGSFIGKRFEYGTNVKGITKTQKVANSEDDTVLFVDNIGIEVFYDVDFALKSAEVPEIEIGDTHYVIDSDFHPPMQIKARIGKIEISFTDPTKNKIYLANNKKIRGSAVDDGLDSYDDSGGHTHDRLVSGDSEIVYSGYTDITEDVTSEYGNGYTKGTYNNYLESSGGTLLLTTDFLRIKDYEKGQLVTKESGYLPELYIYNQNSSADTTALVFTSRNHMIPYANIEEKKGYYDIGDYQNYWRSIHVNDTWTHHIDTIAIQSCLYSLPFDREDMNNVSMITNSGEVTKQDLLNFIMNEVNIYKYIPKREDEQNEDVGLSDSGTYLGILSEDYINHKSGSSCTWTSEVAHLIMRNMLSGDTDNDDDLDDENDHDSHTYNLPSLVCALIAAFQQHVAGGSPDAPSNPGDGSNPSNPGTGDGTITDGFDIVSGNELFVNKIDAIAIEVAKIEVTNRLYVKDIVGTSISQMTTAEINAIKTGIIDVGVKAKIKEIEFPDGTILTSASDAGASVAYITDVTIDSKNHLIITLSNGKKIDAGALPSGGGSNGNTVFDTITVTKIQGPDPGEGQYNRVEFEDGIRVNHIWSADEDGVIHMQDDLALHNSFEVFGDISTDGMVYVNEGIHFADGSVLTSANGSGGSTSGGTLSGIPNGVIEYIKDDTGGMYVGTSWVKVNNDLDVEGNLLISGSLVGASALESVEFLDAREARIDKIEFADGTIMTTAGSGSNSGGGNSGDSNYATIEYVDGEITELKKAAVDFIELKPAIIDFIELEPAIIDLIENGSGGDGTFGDIIVDSLRIYSPEDGNYVPVRLTNAGIGADIIVADSEVGTPRLLVSDEYPDDASITIPPEIVVTRRNTGNSAELKITPDGISFPDGSTLTTANGVSAVSELSEYATVEALQEEIRAKDEQIADLEARLARIEAMLGINNDN